LIGCLASLIIPSSLVLQAGFPDRPLSENGGITAAPMHPTIAPHQIDVTKSKRICR
jgi:hypothetical protein